MTAIQLDPKSTAAVIRKQLKAMFPATTFSVVTERGSMVSSVRVKWTDGPTEKRVNAIVSAFEMGSFNGMTDGYDYNTGADRLLIVDGQTYRTGVRYVSTRREMSDKHWAQVAALVARFYGVDAPSRQDAPRVQVPAAGEYFSTLVYRAVQDRPRYTLSAEG
jgi:hypothetical protein